MTTLEMREAGMFKNAADGWVIEPFQKWSKEPERDAGGGELIPTPHTRWFRRVLRGTGGGARERVTATIGVPDDDEKHGGTRKGVVRV